MYNSNDSVWTVGFKPNRLGFNQTAVTTAVEVNALNYWYLWKLWHVQVVLFQRVCQIQIHKRQVGEWWSMKIEKYYYHYGVGQLQTLDQLLFLFIFLLPHFYVSNSTLNFLKYHLYLSNIFNWVLYVGNNLQKSNFWGKRKWQNFDIQKSRRRKWK